jgi:hypothetical protein
MTHFNEIHIVLTQLKECWINNNWSALSKLYSSNAQLLCSEVNAPHQGTDQIIKFYQNLFKQNSPTQITTLKINESQLSEELTLIYFNIQAQFKAKNFKTIHMSLLLQKKLNQAKIVMHHMSFQKVSELTYQMIDSACV